MLALNIENDLVGQDETRHLKQAFNLLKLIQVKPKAF